MTRQQIHDLVAVLYDAELLNSLDQLAADLADLDDASMIDARLKFESRRVLATVTRRFNEALAQSC